jgi:2-oxoglutarate dehydrogenase E1 component
VEQLYPFADKVLAEELARFPNAQVVWVQEEPRNQGAWTFVAPRIEETLAALGRPAMLPYIGRPEYASTAAGLMSQHTSELQAFLNEALTL